MYILNAALSYISALSCLFQTGDLNFEQIESSVEACKCLLMGMADDELPWRKITLDWAKFEGELGQLQDDDGNTVKSITKYYAEETVRQIENCFPEPKLLGCFKIFDPTLVPKERQLRSSYGREQLQMWWDRYGSLLTDNEREDTVLEWSLFVEKLHREFEDCRDAAEVC